MVKNLEGKVWTAYCKLSRNLRATVLPNFRTEQSSNDHISSLCMQQHSIEALEAFDFLQKCSNICINLSTYAHLLSASSSLRSLGHGKKIHNHIMTSHHQLDVILNNRIINMYGKCGSMKDARKVFDEMIERNIVSWTSVIAGYAQNDQGIEAVELYLRMQHLDLTPDHFTFGSAIRACSSLSNIELGRQLHANVIKSESGSHSIAQNALITMYTKFGQISEASVVFSRTKTRDLISWSSIIAGSSQLGYELEALCFLKEMLFTGVCQPNGSIFGSVLSACGILQQPEYGRQIHGMSLKFGLGRDTVTGCSLSDMYAKCGFLGSAKTAFCQIDQPDLVSWNAIIAGFAYAGDVNTAMSIFSQMRHLELTPDDITVRSLLCACIAPDTLFHGKQLHSYIIKMAFDFDVLVCNTLLSMYGRCLDLFDAFRVFNDIRYYADLVSWNAILTVCMQHNQAGEVFKLFKLFLDSKIKPDHVTLANVLGACGELTSLEMGDQVHCYATKTGLLLGVSVTNGIIDMYSKCGTIGSARRLFDCMEYPDVISWNSLIVGYAQFGYGEEALKLFRNMRSLAVKPNQVTYVGVLTACSHVGLVEEGWHLYNTMEMEHEIVPTREHSSCVIDLLARAGCIKEAEAFITQMPFDPDIVVWKTLLAACKTYNDAEVGERAAENILKIDPSNSAAHVLLCNMYAASGSWKDVARVRSLMKQKSIKKVPGQSWIEMKDKMHVFSAKDGVHPKRDKIYSMLEELWLQMLDAEIVDCDWKSSMLSLVKAFDSLLAKHEDLETKEFSLVEMLQLDLMLKICRGSSISKVLVQEVKSCLATELIVVTAPKHHEILSLKSVAKWSILAVNNVGAQRSQRATTLEATFLLPVENCKREQFAKGTDVDGTRQLTRYLKAAMTCSRVDPKRKAVSY
ncbi:hypothetical protein RJ640_007222 [Escallonia rubra]|uniref:Pentatricopeptide repeat-containing protein n=1 Tax=Escallonia rubra TaxID=112253 RepID=A0AA88R979_9ASTE|nr:hypothetical protein RJ640_007222 [Escallonia rubra]